jgi:hypothetical protein
MKNALPIQILAAQNLPGLADQITELAAHLDAGSYQLLKLIYEFDQQGGWQGVGIQSCAHWLNWKCGINLGAAREKVRVANALPALPTISAAMKEGRVSYSKVRAMTRVATEKNESALLEVALGGTASHVEQQVRLYRKTKKLEALAEENLCHSQRELSWYQDSDGSWVFKGRLSREQGALMAKTMEAAMDQLFEESRHVDEDVSAETSRRMACDCSIVHWHEDKQGNALNIGRKSRSIPPAIRRVLQRRDGGCHFPGCSCTRFVDAHHIKHWADGGETRMDNLVLLCRAHHRLVHEGGFGVQTRTSGAIEFMLPSGNVIPRGPDTRFRGNVVAFKSANRKNGLNITPKTPIPAWYGERMNKQMAIEALLKLE